MTQLLKLLELMDTINDLKKEILRLEFENISELDPNPLLQNWIETLDKEAEHLFTQLENMILSQ
jgi:hypothetical protein